MSVILEPKWPLYIGEKKPPPRRNQVESALMVIARRIAGHGFHGLQLCKPLLGGQAAAPLSRLTSFVFMSPINVTKRDAVTGEMLSAPAACDIH